MALSLEVKKFINSEHVGKFVEIHLPLEGEPVRPPKKNKKAPAEPQPEDVEKTQPEPLPPQEEEDPAFETLRIHYMDEGDGEPLVLVHTIGQSIYTWRCLYASLTQHYRVIAVDMPGFGYSSRPDVYSYTIEEQSKALELFLDAIGIESAHFMGFSMGCAYVMDLCLRQPERAGRVILLAPGGLTPEMPTPVKLLDSGLFGGIAAALFGIRTVENVLSDCFFDLTVGLNEDVVTEYYKTISDSASRRALRLSIHNFEDETLVSQLRTTEMPVLILLGSEDRWRTSAQTELFHAAIPDAGYAMVRNAGHLLHEEKPDKVISAVLEFIPVLAPDVE